MHLVDTRDSQSPEFKKSFSMLRLLVNSLYKMNIAWFWCNRSIMVIESLAEQWGVELQEEGQAQQVDEKSRHSFERYKLLAQGSSPVHATVQWQAHLQPISEDGSGSLNDFGLDLDLFDLGRLYDEFCVPEEQIL